MKYLILGDIHGRSIWRDIVKNENPDYTIFLGDYVSTHDSISDAEQMYNLFSILRYKESCPERIILLRGNHEIKIFNLTFLQ